MASEYDEREADSILEVTRTTLLDVIEERNRTLNKKNLLHRLVFVSKLKEGGDRQATGSHYEKFLKTLQNTFASEPVTGMMLVYFKHIIHVIETSSDMLLELVKDLQKCETEGIGYCGVKKSKILIVSHDIQQRLYSQWSYRLLDVQAARLEAYEPSESNAKLIVDVVTQLMKLGVHLTKQPKLNLKNVLDSLHEKVPDLLPQQGAIYYMLKEDDSCMMTPKEYIDMYEQPFDIILDSDMTWPLPTRLFPYN